MPPSNIRSRIKSDRRRQVPQPPESQQTSYAPQVSSVPSIPDLLLRHLEPRRAGSVEFAANFTTDKDDEIITRAVQDGMQVQADGEQERKEEFSLKTRVWLEEKEGLGRPTRVTTPDDFRRISPAPEDGGSMPNLTLRAPAVSTEDDLTSNVAFGSREILQSGSHTSKESHEPKSQFDQMKQKLRAADARHVELQGRFQQQKGVLLDELNKTKHQMSLMEVEHEREMHFMKEELQAAKKPIPVSSIVSEKPTPGQDQSSVLRDKFTSKATPLPQDYTLLQHQVSQLQKDKRGVEAQLRDIKEEFATSEHDWAQKEGRWLQREDEYDEALTSVQAEVKSNKHKWSRDKANQTKEIETLRKKINGQDRELASKRADAQGMANAHARELQELNTRLSRQGQNIAGQRRALDQRNSENQSLRDELAQKEAVIRNHEADLKKQQSEIEEMKARIMRREASLHNLAHSETQSIAKRDAFIKKLEEDYTRRGETMPKPDGGGEFGKYKS